MARVRRIVAPSSGLHVQSEGARVELVLRRSTRKGGRGQRGTLDGVEGEIVERLFAQRAATPVGAARARHRVLRMLLVVNVWMAAGQRGARVIRVNQDL